MYFFNNKNDSNPTQVCAGAKVLKDWGILSIKLIENAEVFHGLSTGQIESADGFRLPDEFADSLVLCSAAHS